MILSIIAAKYSDMLPGKKTIFLSIMLLLLINLYALHAQELRPQLDKESGLYGYKSLKDNIWVIKPQYSFAGSFNTYVKLAVAGYKGKYGLINYAGQPVSAMSFDSIAPFPIPDNPGGPNQRWRAAISVYYIFRSDTLFGLLDYKGNIAVPASFPLIKWKQGRFIGFKNGFGDISGKILGHNMYLDGFENGVSFFNTEDTKKAGQGRYRGTVHIGMVDTSGKILLPPIYTSIDKKTQIPITLIATDGKIGAVNNKGQIIIPVRYDDIEFYNYDNSYLILHLNGLSYLYDFKANKILFDGKNFKGVWSYMPHPYFIIVNGKLQGLGRIDGKIIVNTIYDSIGRIYTSSAYIVKKGKYYGIIDTLGHELTPPEYSSLVDVYSIGGAISSYPLCFILRKNKLFGLASINGKLLLAASYEYIELQKQENDTMIFFAKNGNKAHNIFVYKDYVDIRPFNSNGGFSVIGNKIPGPNYDETHDYLYGQNPGTQRRRYAFKNESGQKSYLLNDKGEIVLSEDKYAFGNVIKNEYVEVCGPLGMGIMNTKGKMVVPALYRHIINVGSFYKERHFSTGWQSDNTLDPRNDNYYYCETQDGKMGLMDQKFKLILDTTYLAISENEGCWFANKSTSDTSWTLISSDGSKVLYSSVAAPFYNFGNALAIRQKGKYGLINKDASPLCGFEYNSMRIPINNIILVQKDTKYGIMDEKGKLILPCEYDYINVFVDGYSQITRDGKTGIIDSNGHIVVEPLYKNLYNTSQALAQFYKPVLASQQQFAERPYKGGYNNDICHNTAKTKDSLPGINTTLYAYYRGYYELLASYPDAKNMNRVNNYIINYILTNYRTPYPNYSDSRHQIKIAKYLEEAPLLMEKALISESRSGCNQVDFSLIFLSKNLIGVKSNSITTTSSYNNKSKNVIGYQYLYLYADSIALLKTDMILNPGAWADTLANRYLKARGDKWRTINKRSMEQIENANTNDRKSILMVINGIYPNSVYPYTIEKEAITWAIRYDDEIIPVTMSYKELKPYLKENNPLQELIKK